MCGKKSVFHYNIHAMPDTALASAAGQLEKDFTVGAGTNVSLGALESKKEAVIEGLTDYIR